MPSPILQPVVALVAWSMVMWAWLYATRIPAMRAAKVPMDPNLTADVLNAAIPPHVRWKADNYNHLMEQPTVFYAVAFALALMGSGDGWALRFAWAYVALRVVHSLVQSLWNCIEVRFLLFTLSTFALIGMVVIAVRIVVRTM